MKTKKEILAMSASELQSYKWSEDLNIKEEKEDTNSNCSGCSYCSNCSYCSDCSDCSDCSNCSRCYDLLYCRNMKSERKGYFICNVEVTKEEFDKKKAELK